MNMGYELRTMKMLTSKFRDSKLEEPTPLDGVCCRPGAGVEGQLLQHLSRRSLQFVYQLLSGDMSSHLWPAFLGGLDGLDCCPPVVFSPLHSV